MSTVNLALNADSIDQIANCFHGVTGITLEKRYGDNYGGTYYIHEVEQLRVVLQRNYFHLDDDFNEPDYKQYEFILEMSTKTNPKMLEDVVESFSVSFGNRCVRINRAP